ncbi:MAG: hypothetical protein R3A52_21750 [Polyangiales bacterium]
MKVSVAWLAANDPPVYQRLSRALRHDASYADLEEAVDAVLALPEPRLAHHAVLRTIDAVKGSDDANRFRKNMRKAFEQGRVERLLTPRARTSSAPSARRCAPRTSTAQRSPGSAPSRLRALATSTRERVAVWRFEGSRSTCELYTDASGQELIGWTIPV